MSIFVDLLQSAVERLPGVTGAVFADWEGEAVGSVALSTTESTVRIIGAHWGIVYFRCREMFDKLQLGSIDQIVLRFAGQCVVVGRVTDEYFVVLSLGADGHLGGALRALERLRDQLRAEM